MPVTYDSYSSERRVTWLEIFQVFAAKTRSHDSKRNRCEHPLAGLLAERLFEKVEGGLAKVNLDPAAAVARTLARAIRRAINLLALSTHLPPGCALDVREVEDETSHRVGAVIFLMVLEAGKIDQDELARAILDLRQELNDAFSAMLKLRRPGAGQMTIDEIGNVCREDHKSFAKKFNEGFRERADLARWNPAVDGHLAVLHLESIPLAGSGATSGKIVWLTGAVVEVQKQRAMMTLIKDAGTVVLEFARNQFFTKFHLLALAAAMCEVRATEIHYRERGQ